MKILSRELITFNDRLFEIIKIVKEETVQQNNQAIQYGKDFFECDACLRSKDHPNKLLFCRSIDEAEIIE